MVSWAPGHAACGYYIAEQSKLIWGYVVDFIFMLWWGRAVACYKVALGAVVAERYL